MSWLFYNLFIRIYGICIHFLAPFLPKAHKWVQGRKQWRQMLQAKMPLDSPVVWMHCASLGEFEQGRPLLEAMKQNNPHHFYLLTFYSPSGFEVRKNYPLADHVCYLPLDTPSNARDFVQLVKPQKALIVKYEFWFNLLNALHQHSIPTYLISGIFRPNQLFFKPWGKAFIPYLNAFTHFFLQDEVSARMLQQLGFSNCSISGDTRYDRVLNLPSSNFEHSFIEQFVAGTPCLVAGSTWSADDDCIAKAFSSPALHHVKIIVATHEIDESSLRKAEETYGLLGKVKRLSGLNENNSEEFRVLLIDNIGMLSSIYRFATMCYIGGGFGKGIHNVLEAATYGKPVIFGPKYSKFLEAQLLIQNKGGFSVKNADELFKIANQFCEDSERLKTAGDAARNQVMYEAGATQKILSFFQPVSQ